MALSDSCYNYLNAVADAAKVLAAEAHHYSDPNSAFAYGQEIDALRRACVAAVGAPYDPDAACRVIRLAASVMAYHDTLPKTPQETERRAAMGS